MSLFFFIFLRTLRYPVSPINDCSQGHSYGIKPELFHARSKGITLKRNSLTKLKTISIEIAAELASTTK